MSNKLTSRSYILDAVALLQEEVAKVNHLQELIMDTIKWMEWAVKDNIDATPWIKDYELLQWLLKESLAIRRNVTNMLFNSVDTGDHRYWCLFKHALSSYQFATECWYANIEDRDRPVVCKDLYQQLVTVMSLFFWLDEVETCGRCLADKIEEEQKNKSIQ